MALFSAVVGERLDSLIAGEVHTPERIDQAFEKARWWFRYNPFIRRVILMRFAFYDYLFKIVPVDKADTKRVQRWAAAPAVAKSIRNYRRDAWLEWLQLDNIVGFWREHGGVPQAWPPESCQFTDTFGKETLSLRHGLTSEQVRKLGLTKKERDFLLAHPCQMQLTNDGEPFAFDVVKRERVGAGLARPGLECVFRTAAQQESLEVRDALLAQVGRLVYEQHALGHEIKSGLHAGSKANFCTPKKAAAVEEALRGKTGHVRFVDNFDHKILFPAPDPAQYDGRKYLACVDRLMLWAMPVGQIILTKTLNPYLMEVFRTEAAAERDYLAPHLAQVFRESLGCPVPITVKWSDRCFRDSRLAADLLKTGLSSGPLSQGTFIESAGYEIDEERARKTEEAGLPPAVTEPIYDGNHGKPGKAPGPKSGSNNQTQ